MAWLRQLRNILRPGRLQRDLQKELAFHVTERADELRQAGMSEAEAERTAHRQFGNLTAQVERTRDMDTPNVWKQHCEICGWPCAAWRRRRHFR